jgi:hypothetical protein
MAKRAAEPKAWSNIRSYSKRLNKEKLGFTSEKTSATPVRGWMASTATVYPSAMQRPNSRGSRRTAYRNPNLGGGTIDAPNRASARHRPR